MFVKWNSIALADPRCGSLAPNTHGVTVTNGSYTVFNISRLQAFHLWKFRNSTHDELIRKLLICQHIVIFVFWSVSCTVDNKQNFGQNIARSQAAMNLHNFQVKQNTFRLGEIRNAGGFHE